MQTKEPNNTEALKTQLVHADPNPDADRISLRETIMRYLAYWPLFLCIFVLLVGATYLFIRYSNPVYNTTIEILVKDDEKKGGDDISGAILSELLFNGKSNFANELELVKSRTTMEKVVRNLGINILYIADARFKKTELYDTTGNLQVRFLNITDSSQQYAVEIEIKGDKIHYITDSGDQVIAGNSLVKTPDFNFVVNIRDSRLLHQRYLYKAIWYSPALMAQKLTDILNVDVVNKDASIMEVSLKSQAPAKARDILNGLAGEYAQREVDYKNKTLDNTTRFVDERLLLISGDLNTIENSLKDFREKNNVIDTGQLTLVLERSKELTDQLDELEIKLKVTDMIQQYLQDTTNRFSLVPSSLGIEDLTLAQLVKAYNTGAIQLDQMEKTVQPGNIAVITLKGQLEQLRQSILENTRNIRGTYTSSYNKVKTDYDQVMAALGTLPSKQKQLLEIERDQAIKEKLYLYLLEKKEETAINRASSVANSYPIDPAITAIEPSSPKKTILYILAVLLGLGIPFLVIYILDRLNDKIVSRDDIVKHTKVPIAGEVNHKPGVASERKIVVDKSRGVIAEQFRIIRTNLRYMLPTDRHSTILITSTMPGEGKTFISINLAAVLSLNDKKTIIIDLDLRKPKVGPALNAHSDKGLSSYLVGSATSDDIIQKVEGLDYLYVITAGPIPPNPAEIILNARLDTLIAELQQSFDYVIIDSPPIGIVSDAKVLTKYSTVNLYVIRQRYTLKKQIEFIDELYTTQVLKNMALITNDVIMEGTSGYYRTGYNYGYGVKYGYGYTYDHSFAYGYNTESESASWWSRFTSIFKRK